MPIRSVLVSVVVAWSFLPVTAVAAPTFKKATKATRGPQACSGDAFLDLRLDDPSAGAQCWTCPKGYVRTLEPVTSDEACAKPSTTALKEADFRHKWFCDPDNDEFFDPRKGGECWRCPKKHPRRTAYAVTSKKACATRAIVGESLTEAIYEHKRKNCTGRAFFDPRGGGECWACPKGYTRTAEPVTSKKACAKDSDEKLKPAAKEGPFGCASGQFLDPRNGGECWSCPASHPHRTINVVTGDKACTDDPLGVIAVDPPSFCKDVIAALARSRSEGEKAVDRLQALIDPVVAPVRDPILRKVDEMSELVGGEELLEPVLAKVPGDLVEKTAEFGRAAGNGAGAIVDVLLDTRVCTDAPTAIEKRLAAAAKLPKWMDKQYASFSVGVTFTHPTYKATTTVALTWISNLGGDGGLFISAGLGATSSPEPFSMGFSAMFLPDRTLKDFGLSAVPGITVSIAKGGAFEDLFKNMKSILPLVSVVDGIDVAWSPETPARWPTLGISKGLVSVGSAGNAVLTATATSGWDFPIVVYENGKVR